jgi:bifunctional DNase/RNase
MDPMGEVVQVRVSALVRDARTDAPVVLLQIPGTRRHLPIWIGDAEANAIALALAGRRFERPLTHDLLQQVIDGLGAELSRVTITELQGNTFFARLQLQRGHEVVAVDARPSDSIALALRCEAPIFLSQGILQDSEASLVELDQEGSTAEEVERLIRDVELGIGRDQPEPEPEEDDEEEDDEWPSSGPGEG